MSQAEASKQNSRRTLVLRLLSLLAFILITVTVFYFRDQAQELAVYGYPGIFLVAMMSSATVLFPAPGLAVVFTMAGIFHPLGVALSAATGAALGELTGYLAGIGGRMMLERTDADEKLLPFVEKYGMLAIVILAAIPNPFFDAASIAAGALKMKVWKFLIAAWIGQVIKMTAVAYLGASSINWLLD